MTIRKMLKAVLDDPARFLNGWKTSVRDFFKAIGRDHLEHKQTKVWMLTIRKAYEGVMPDTVICRKLATAKAKLEADISETLANADGEFDPADLNRMSDTRVTIGEGDEVQQVIMQVALATNKRGIYVYDRGGDGDVMFAFSSRTRWISSSGSWETGIWSTGARERSWPAISRPSVC